MSFIEYLIISYTHGILVTVSNKKKIQHFN